MDKDNLLIWGIMGCLALATIGLIIKNAILFIIGGIPVAIAAAWASAKTSQERYKHAVESVERNGLDWAIQELVLHPNMSEDRKNGIRRGIQDAQRQQGANHEF
jgi:hypothetical protein